MHPPLTVRGVTPSRSVAAAVLASLRGGALLDVAFERDATGLDSRDRRWAQELVYGLLRRRGWIDAALQARVSGGLARLDPDLLDLLRAGTYQLIAMGSVPPYAAIAQTVELVKLRHGMGASKLANAVLRRVDRERDALVTDVPSDPIDALAVAYSHPRWLVSRWVARWGAAAAEALLESNNHEAPLILRPWGMVREQLEAALEAAEVQVADTVLVADSIRINGHPALHDLAPFAQGHCFVQDPAATLVTRYAALPAGARVADLCAAPGGKSLELARTARFVASADRSSPRLTRLRATLERLDAPNIAPVVADALTPPFAAMDAVLVDAPCTGTGTFRRHPDARWRLKISDLATLAATQRAILASCASTVRVGGLLIYSTCSLEAEENDVQVDDFLAARKDFVLEPPPEGAVPAECLDAGRLRVLPHLHGADGAFAARFRRIA
ncbi:MAG: hypothetical protein K2X99_03935 [Gemmatimonadaceae bacterium]|nr:hypothetical protein [Gemmatimonadaceae bacterium]